MRTSNQMITFFVLLTGTFVCAEVTPSSYDEHSDEELHQNQIPAPNLQPSEEEVKQAILHLVAYMGPKASREDMLAASQA